MKKKKKTSVVLREAKEVIRLDGWNQGPDGMRVNGPKCILGAVAKAYGDVVEINGRVDTPYAAEYNLDDAETSPAGRALWACLGEPPYRFNDRIGRTQAEVLAALESCAQVEEAAGR